MLPKGDKYIAYLEECKAYDPEEELAKYTAGMAQGAVSRNDFRTHLLHLPPIQGGDTCFVPGVGEVPVVREGEPMPTRPALQRPSLLAHG